MEAKEKRQNPPVLSSKEASEWEEANSRDDGKCSLSSIERLAFMLFPRNCFGDPGVVDGVSSDTHGDAAHYEKLYSLYKPTLKKINS